MSEVAMVPEQVPARGEDGQAVPAAIAEAAPSSERFVDGVTAARFLAISPGHIRRLTSQKRLPHYKPFTEGGRTLFLLSELSAFVRSKRVEPRG